MTDGDLNRLIGAYEARNPSLWHQPCELPEATLEALKQLRDLRYALADVQRVLDERGGLTLCPT